MLSVKSVLLLTYFVFGLILNSVGVVILQVIRVYGVSKEAASSLEGLKDLPIAWVSLLAAPYLVKIGYKNSIVAALLCVGIACAGMTQIQSFRMSQVLFLVTGCSFALVKVSVYSTIGLITVDSSTHASLLSLIEGSFMLGVLSGYWLFSYYMTPQTGVSSQDNSWLQVYYVLCGLSGFVAILVSLSPFDGVSNSALAHETNGGNSGGWVLLKVVKNKIVICYLFTAFLYVMVEQGIGTWLPTFNSEVFHMPQDMSVQITSIFAAGLAFGRLSAGLVLRRVEWHVCIYICICGAITILLTGLYMTSISNVYARYVLPCVGFFLAPVYPALTSAVLSSLPKSLQAPLTGLVTMSSAIGGSSGSLLTGFIFARVNGVVAFTMSIPALAFIFMLVKILRSSLDTQKENRKLTVGLPVISEEA